ncbi:MAG TPA: ATP-binding protein [Gemmatimonadales bacterium]|jgi:two-component system NtrC family sensor kinase
MHPPVQAVSGLFKAVLIIGPVVEWASALLLVGAFVLLLPLSSQRRLVVIWLTAWAAQAFSLTYPALESIGQIVHSAGGPGLGMWATIILPFFWPARFLFIAAVGFGGLSAAGRRAPVHIERSALIAVAIFGIGLGVLDADRIGGVVEAIATPLVFFGAAQFIFTAAVGPRFRGLTFLGVVTTLYGTLATCYLIDKLSPGSTGSLMTLIHVVRFSALYGDAIALALLGVGVIVVIVQEAFLDVIEAHEKRIRAVAESEFRLNDIIQAAQEAIVTFDAGGRIELANEGAALLLGVEPGALVGQPISGVIDRPTESVLDLMHEAEVRANRDLITYPASGIRVDGERFPIEFTVGRLRNAEKPGGVVVIRDLTLQQAMLAEREEFERKMAESEKMMAIGRVVSGVAHELNNPLAVVLGESEQLAETAPGGEVRTGLRMIHEQANRARHIIRDLLAFVRHRDDQREEINPVHLVERTVATLRPVAEARSVTLTADIPDRMHAIRVDPAAIEQVLVNLIDNAFDAVPAGGAVRVRIRIAGDRVELIVDDTGPGIPDELVGKVFEPFYTTKETGRGPGLGLSVSFGIAEQHDGSLRLENRPASGIGARFILSLPSAGPVADTTPAMKRPFPSPPLRDGKAAEVMLIDDEPAVRATLAKLFARTGWQVRQAASGHEAIEWLAQVSDSDAPVVILCDLKMPGMGGQEFHREISRTRPALAKRVIFVTGDAVESVSSGFIAASGCQVVEKPFTVAEIARAVSTTVNGE